jgi:hypothetical protein
VAFCTSCGTELPAQARFCPGCGTPTGVDEEKPPPVLHGPTGPIPGTRDSSIIAWLLSGAVVGLLVGLVAVKLTNQALCPHSILGPCQTLNSRGRTWIVIAGVIVGAIIGRLIGGARSRR